MAVDIDVFIAEHKHINYCEAIIYRDGTLEYVKPSHVETLLRITGEDRDEVYNKMDIWDSPIDWLTEYTGCVSVWYEGCIRPKNCTPEQLASLKKLIDHKIIIGKSFR